MIDIRRKYRAWDDKDKKWLLGYEYGNLGGFSMFGECMLFGEWAAIIERFIVSQADRKPKDLILMESVCRIDVDGKDIYEGDIVDVKDGADGMPHEMKSGRYVVKYSLVDCAYILESLHGNRGVSFDEVCQYKVVGNIYEDIVKGKDMN